MPPPDRTNFPSPCAISLLGPDLALYCQIKKSDSNKMNILLTEYRKGSLALKNHIVMAPMTRSRAVNNLPNDLMATYYGQL